MADSIGLLEFDSAIGQGSPHIVVEETFHLRHVMRPYALKAAAAGYEVKIHTPHTEWANDPVECASRSAKPVTAEDMDRTWRQWESVDSLEDITAASTPSERLAAAKLLLAEIDGLRSGPDGADNKEAEAKIQQLSSNYPTELGLLGYLGYFDARFLDRVRHEHSAVLAEHTQEISRDIVYAEPSPADIAKMDRDLTTALGLEAARSSEPGHRGLEL
jgi:hypothetical protein